MPHFGINQLFLSPLKVCDLLRNRCAIYPGITVRFDADFANAANYAWKASITLTGFGRIHVFWKANH